MRLAIVFVLAAALAGCDLFGGEAADKAAALKEADGKAVGSACRHAGRAIEDCYALHPKAQRPAIFAGWREMDEYMRENKLEPVPPLLAVATAVAAVNDADAAAAAAAASSPEPPASRAAKAKPAHRP